MESNERPKSKRGGARPGAGRKPSDKTRTRPERKAIPKVGEQANPAVALTPSIVERAHRAALLAQRDAIVKDMTEKGIAPLDVLHATMYRLYAKANEARDAGGILMTVKAPQPIFVNDEHGNPTTVPAVDHDGKQLYTRAEWHFDYETTLLVACADVANKAAAYVHPKLAAVALTKTEETFEEMLERRAAARAAHLNLAPGGQIREVQAA